MRGTFGLFLFGGIAMWYGVPRGRHLVGGTAARLVRPVPLARLELPDYGLFNTPEGEGIVGLADLRRHVRAMGVAPLLGGLAVFGSAPRRRALVGAIRRSRPGHRLRPARRRSQAGVPRRRGVAGGRRTRPTDERREELPEIAGDMGAVITEALHGQAAPERDQRGTQALLDRLERLADLRDRGMLGEEEYETAKETVVRELETRQ